MISCHPPSFSIHCGRYFNWLAHLHGCCSIIYDARDVRGRPSHVRIAEDIFPKMKNLGPQFEGVYQGKTSETSQETPGLMLVDLICGELRKFMLNSSWLWNDGSSIALITPTSNEGEVIWQSIGGRMVKWGSKKQMSDATVATALATARIEDPFTLLLPALADTKLSCYAHFGEAEVIDFQGKRLQRHGRLADCIRRRIRSRPSSPSGFSSRACATSAARLLRAGNR